MTDVIKPPFFKAKGSEIQQTTPSIPSEALQVQERLDRIENALAHPFQTLQDIHANVAEQSGYLKTLVQDNLIRRAFTDTSISIGATVNYQLEYDRHLYAYLLSNTSFTLSVSNGITIPIIANQWNNVSMPRNSYFTIVGGSDTQLTTCTIRTCDTPLDTQSSSGGTTSFPVSTNSYTATGLTSGAISVTFPAVAAKTAVVTGFIVSAGGGLNFVTTGVTLTDGTWNYGLAYNQSNGGNGSDTIGQNFLPNGIAASAVNTAIILNVPAIATGGAVTVSIWGYYK
jgi:hypothetical protein